MSMSSADKDQSAASAVTKVAEILVQSVISSGSELASGGDGPSFLEKTTFPTTSRSSDLTKTRTSSGTRGP